MPVARTCGTVLSVPFLKVGVGVATQETFEIGMVEVPGHQLTFGLHRYRPRTAALARARCM